MNDTTLDDRYMPFRSSCTGCKHFNVIDYTCPAFPKGIPTEILTGELKHDRVLKNQLGGTVREEKEGRAHP